MKSSVSVCVPREPEQARDHAEARVPARLPRVQP